MSIEVRSLSKQFGGFAALREVSFEVKSGELLALLVSESEPSADTSWGFILGHYPEAVIDLVRANVGFLRRGR